MTSFQDYPKLLNNLLFTEFDSDPVSWFCSCSINKHYRRMIILLMLAENTLFWVKIIALGFNFVDIYNAKITLLVTLHKD